MNRLTLYSPQNRTEQNRTEQNRTEQNNDAIQIKKGLSIMLKPFKL